MYEKIEALAELKALSEDYLLACELYERAVGTNNSKEKILLLGKRVTNLYNEIQTRIKSNPRVIQLESSHFPSEAMINAGL